MHIAVNAGRQLTVPYSLVTAWSADSRQILFAVTPGETTGPAEEWGQDLLVRKAPNQPDLRNATIHPLRRNPGAIQATK